MSFINWGKSDAEKGDDAEKGKAEGEANVSLNVDSLTLLVAETEAQLEQAKALQSEIDDLQDQIADQPAASPGASDPEGTIENVEQLKALVALEAEADVLYAYESVNVSDIVTGFPDIGTVPDKLAARIQAVSEPYVKILEVPMFSETVSVVDNPPLAPHVTIDGFVGTNNKIMFSFVNAVGEEEAVPVILPGDDPNLFDKVRRKQDRDYTYNDTEYSSENKSTEHVKKKITYKSDDYAAQYQVFRKSTKPSSPNDFTLEDMVGNLDTKTSTSFVDIVSPNSKTYYMFRTVDAHGLTSNPTPTYQVEIVDDDGAIYVLVDVVDYQKKKPKGSKSIPFKRYLQLDPAFLQNLINENQTDFGDNGTAVGTNPVIGVVADSIYDNKKFKVRVTSRSTGKKMDINLEFKKQMDEKGVLEQPGIY